MTSISNKIIALAFAGIIALPVAASARVHQDVVKDARGNVVVDSNGGCVRTQWDANTSVDCAGGRVRSVYFEFNKSTLTREARSALDEIVSYIKNPENSIKSITIVGYADTIGHDSYNQRLSEKRAKHVKKYIESKGYRHTRRIEVRGLGESKTSEDKCKDLSGRAKIDCLWEERRVDIELNM